MQINKLIFIIISLLLIGCRAEKHEINEVKPEKNIIKESLNKIILESEDLGLIGKVRSTLEYEFASTKLSDEKVNLIGSKYHSISADSLIKEIRNVEIKESNSYLFDESGKLIKDIRYVNDGEVYMEVFEQYFFNNQGRLIEWNDSDFDKKIDAQKLFSYDKKGRLIELKEFHFYDSLVSIMNISYKLDTIILEEVTTKGRDTTYAWKAKYDKYGELVENNAEEYREYGKNGNLVKLTYVGFGSNFSPFSITYDYDYRNNKIKETQYDSTNSVVSTEMFYYSEKDELIQSIEIDTSGTEIKRFNEYGNVIEYSSIPFSEDDRSFYNFWMNFDKYGNVIKRVSLDKDMNGNLFERISKTEIDYDEFGNWISKRIFKNDSLTTQFEREIIYY